MRGGRGSQLSGWRRRWEGNARSPPTAIASVDGEKKNGHEKEAERAKQTAHGGRGAEGGGAA